MDCFGVSKEEMLRVTALVETFQQDIAYIGMRKCYSLVNGSMLHDLKELFLTDLPVIVSVELIDHGLKFLF